jgi:hypothetical protein
VTDKGVPAALLMATTRANLRAAAKRFENPGEVLAHVNEVLCPDIANMFILPVPCSIRARRAALRQRGPRPALRVVARPWKTCARAAYARADDGHGLRRKPNHRAGESVLFYSNGWSGPQPQRGCSDSRA